MNLAQTILRKLPTPRNNLLYKTTVSKTLVCQSSNKGASSSSSSSSESDGESKQKTSNTDAVTRLNSLLQQMVSDDASRAQSKIQLAQPTNKREQGRKEKETVISQSVEAQVVNAVKSVAETLGGNTKQTESELLMKLLSPPVENEQGTSKSLSDILKGMTIEREAKPQPSKAEQVRSVLQKFSRNSQTQEDRPVYQRRLKRVAVPSTVDQSQPQPVDLFGSEPLGIFTNAPDLKDSPQLETWQKLHERELKLAITHPPANYFQEMILWTEQGKFWQFPINNEIGLEEEKKVYFAEHVFLEEHLEPWCPPKGPIRHFMELVCVGLSKNSYLTVEAKRGHIEWYKNYFEEKKKLLQEVGAMPSGPTTPNKSIGAE